MQPEQLTQEQLDRIAHNLRTQDNAATAYPIFTVEQKRREWGVDPDYETDGHLWADRNDAGAAPLADNEILSRMAELVADGEITIEEAEVDFDDKHIYVGDEHFERVYYRDRWEFDSAHFTREGAERYLQLNGHNLTEPRIYVHSQFRCAEWLAVVEALKQGRLRIVEQEECHAA